MTFPFLTLPPFAAGCGDPGTVIPYGCAFDGASSYLSRTPSAQGNRRRWTFAAWFRRAGIAEGQSYALFDGGTANSSISAVQLRVHNTSDTIGLVQTSGGGTVINKQSSRLLRDPGGWYHYVLIYDADNAAAEDRLRMYLNGERITEFTADGNTNPASGLDSLISGIWPHRIGRSISTAADPFSGSMADVIMLDGIAADPTAFGRVNRAGVWVSRRYTGSYGAQGWHLDFSDADNLGRDVSGNGNHWTPHGLAATSQVTDTPTNTVATLNPLAVSALGGSSAVLTDNNLRMAWSHGTNVMKQFALTMTPQRPGYLEITPAHQSISGSGTTVYVRLIRANAVLEILNYFSGLMVRHNGIQVSLTAGIGDGQVIGLMMGDDGVVSIAVDGGPRFSSAFLSGPPTEIWIGGGTQSSGEFRLNCGQRPWVYPPPAAHAISAPALPCPPIQRPSHYMAVRQTGGGAGVSDLPWNPLEAKTLVLSKRLDGSSDWAVTDSVRGSGRVWAANTTAAEANEAGAGLTFTASGYGVGTASAYQGQRLDLVWRASPTAGFDIVAVSHTAGTASTVPHAVGGIIDYAWVVPAATGGTRRVYHRALGGDRYQTLGTGGVGTDSGWLTSTSTTLTLAAGMPSGVYHVYAWRSVPQFSAFSSYTGTGNANGPVLPMDFTPKLLLSKGPDASHESVVTRFGQHNPERRSLRMDRPDGEVTSDPMAVDAVSSGVKIRGAAGNRNTDGVLYTYAAWAAVPGKFSRAR